MTAEIIDLKEREASQEVIDMFRDLLEAAEAGDIRSAIVVAETPSAVASDIWVIDQRTNLVTLVGALALAQYDLSTKVCLERDDTVLSQTLYE